jgi:serine/threonine protein kinase
MMIKNIGTFSDKYVIDKKLGDGASCTCMRAWDINTKTPYAIKFFKRDFDKDMIQSEVSLMKSLDHPNLVRAIDAGNETFYHVNGKT